MNHATMTATVNVSIAVSPRDDLSVAMSLQVRVIERDGGYHLRFTSICGKPLHDELAITSCTTPEDALALGVWDVLSDASATLREAIETEPIG